MPQQNPKTQKNGIKTNVLILCIFLSLLGLFVVYTMDFLENTEPQSPQSTLEKAEVTIAASKMLVPVSWIVSELNPEQTILNLLQLQLPVTIENRQHSINVTLLPVSRAAPSAYLLDSLYIHNFAPGPSEQYYGLVVKKLKNDAGFEDEAIWYDALSANPFVAKCLDETTASENAKNCITTILINKRVSALIQFEKSMLPVWRQFSALLNERLGALNSD